MDKYNKSSPILKHSPLALTKGKVNAILGPTNTGKTSYALERMLTHPTGLIGLPLRLLAREIYGKLCTMTDPTNVSLITGEEKIKPKGARYHVATVEAMPLDLNTSFVAIDEVQLAADLERGHIFTDRLLNIRGRFETLLLGAETIRSLLTQLIPDINISTRPRLSTLTYTGVRKISRLPRRSAIVAFSAQEVYEIAELVRRTHGGAAVVLGALSPRTRNAQVALYQSGEVDYLVATDAIGMGLNLDVEHVAFASDRKFDGHQYRRLHPSEFAQIAGRAGRAITNGTFGTTGRCPEFEQELIEDLEAHRFESAKMLQWRNHALDFSSIEGLIESLDVLPRRQGLARAPIAIDQRVLELGSKNRTIRDLAKGREAIEILWDCCLLPDYRRISPQAHADIVLTIAEYLLRDRFIPDEWFALQVDDCTGLSGDIDTLSHRLAKIRTWTYVAQKKNWLKRANYWQNETRRIEDILSDALHDKLTARFTDKRTGVLRRRLREKNMSEAVIEKTGEVLVEGQPIGRMEGFLFTPDSSASGVDMKTLKEAASSALAGEILRRAERVNNAADDQFILTHDNVVRFQGEAIARLFPGGDAMSPQIRVLADEMLIGSDLDNVRARLDYWLKAQIRKHLGGLIDIETDATLVGMAKGLAFQLKENFGMLDRLKVLNDVKALDADGRSALRKVGVRFGAYHIFIPALLKPHPRAFALQLWALKNGSEDKGVTELPTLLLAGRTSLPRDPDISDEAYRIAGYRAFETRALRLDILERIADLIRPALMYREIAETMPPEGWVKGGFIVTPGMVSLAGASGEDFTNLLKSLGYKSEKREVPTIIPEPTLIETTESETPIEGTSVVEPTFIEVWHQGNKFDGASKKNYAKKDPKPREPRTYVIPPAPVKIIPEAREKPKFDKPKKDFSKFDSKKPAGGKPEFKKSDEKKNFTKERQDKPFLTTQKPKSNEPDPDSPFAKLLALKAAMGK